MKLIILIGPHAVGKMTVGQSLSQKTGIPLFHNHVSIELSTELLGLFNAKQMALSNALREVIFDHVSKAQQEGLIFTFMWAFDEKADEEYLNHLENRFKDQGAEVYYVELEADKEVRFERNHTENRLKHKATKRNLDLSNHLFKTLEEKHRLNSLPGEVKKENYLKINNTHLEPNEVADQIIHYFRWN
ncbi:MAG: shikimate kinase [Acholeplasma sp.]|jgi:nitric oxide synthase oxygenase domain/subunit|nr:MAG: shikimate kinase [Acholeplasma sp.]